MTNSISFQPTTYEQPTRAKRLLWFLLLWGLGMVVVGMGYFVMPATIPKAFYKTAVPLVLLIITWLTGRKEGLRPYQPLFRSLFAVALGLWLAWVVNQVWDIMEDSPTATTVLKLLEVVPVVAAILVVNWLAGHNLAWLYLRQGRIWRSFGFGLLAAVLLAIPFFTTGGYQVIAAGGTSYLVAWLPAILVFSIANAFMEELWFRGLWLREFGEFLGGHTALWLTTLIFVMMHVVVYVGATAVVMLLQLTLSWLFLALACGIITQKTSSLWGAVLLHTVADILFLLVAFAS